MSNPKFDTKKFIADQWGSPDRLYRWLTGYGYEVSRQQVYKQVQRANIPAEQFAVTLCLLEMQNGKPVSLVEYLL